MRHKIELCGPNAEDLGTLESDDCATFEESFKNLEDKVAAHIIKNKIKTIQMAFGGLSYSEDMPKGNVFPSGWAKMIVQDAIERHKTEIEEAFK